MLLWYGKWCIPTWVDQTHWKDPILSQRQAGGEEDDRGYGWMSAQWSWVWKTIKVVEDRRLDICSHGSMRFRQWLVSQTTQNNVGLYEKPIFRNHTHEHWACMLCSRVTGQHNLIRRRKGYWRMNHSQRKMLLSLHGTLWEWEHYVFWKVKVSAIFIYSCSQHSSWTDKYVITVLQLPVLWVHITSLMWLILLTYHKTYSTSLTRGSCLPILPKSSHSHFFFLNNNSQSSMSFLFFQSLCCCSPYRS